MTSHRTSPAARAGHSVIRVPRAVARMQGYQPSERVLSDVDLRVYLAMVDLADNSSRLLRTSVDRVAHRAGVSTRSVRRTLTSQVLPDLGLMTEVEDGYVHLQAPGDITEGGFLSVPRAALWASPDASMVMPTYAVQALLLLIAHSDWGGDASTSLRCDRHIETMAGGGSVDRLKRGLGYLDALPWVRAEQRGYVSTLQRGSTPRRLASVRTLDWAALPAYQPRAVNLVAEALEAPLRRNEAGVALTPAPTPVLPAQRRTEAVATEQNLPARFDVETLATQIVTARGGVVSARVAVAHDGMGDSLRDDLVSHLVRLRDLSDVSEAQIAAHLGAAAEKVKRDELTKALAGTDLQWKHWLLGAGLPKAPPAPLTADEVVDSVMDISRSHLLFQESNRDLVRLRKRVTSLMEAGWEGRSIVGYVDYREATSKTLSSPLSWVFAVGLPTDDDAINEVPAPKQGRINEPLPLRESYFEPEAPY